MSRRLKIGLVDDEPLARMRMRHLLQACDTPNAVVGEWSHGGALLASAQHWSQAEEDLGERPDALFLDIEMPGGNGLALARELNAMRVNCAVVFVTAHPEHALAAFEVDAMDYLTKPIRQDRLEAALQRLATRLGKDVHRSASWLVPHQGGLLRVGLDDVLYFKAEHKHVVMRTRDAFHQMDVSLNELAQQCGDVLIRVHRNALVSVGAMQGLVKRVDPASDQESWFLTVAPLGESLAVSRRQIALVKEKMANR